MRKAAFIFLVLLLLALPLLQADARKRIDENSTWEEILNSPSHRAFFPKEQVESWFPYIYQLCVNGDVLQMTVSDCVRSRDLGDSTQCLEYADRVITKPISYQDSYCAETGAEGNCTRHETYTRTIPLVYEIKVRDEIGLEFKKVYEISACQ